MSDFLVDLDDLGNGKKNESVPDQQQSLTEVGGDLVLSTTAKKIVVGPKTLSELAEQFLKLIFTVDVSGSMDGYLLPDNPRTLYVWTEENMTKIQEAIADAVKSLGQPVTDSEGEAEEHEHTVAEGLGVDPNDPDALLASLFGGAQAFMDPKVAVAALAKFTDHEALQDAVVMLGLAHLFGVEQKWGREEPQGPMTKLAALKQHIRKVVEERYIKYERADIRLIEFDHRVSVRGAHTKATLLQAVDAMFARGGTDIYPAVRASIELCQKAPSPLRAHHIVLVTDGMASDALELPGLIPDMTEMNVVLDVILLVSSTDTSLFQGLQYHQAIEKTCRATGGEFVRVMREKDFEQKFFEASHRLCLPAPPTKL